MNLRFPTVVLSLFCAQGAFASTGYSFGTTQPFDLYNGVTTSTAGVWTEVPGNTGQSIDCINALGNLANICGNPGPDNSVSINLPNAPGNQAILPGGTTNYLIVDGDDRYGAPVATDMTGLTVGDVYQVSFYQASSEETGNNQRDTDQWQVYIIPGATSGVYICPTCLIPVNPDPGDLAFTSTAISNPGGPTSTNWQQQVFTFTATQATELLEFVTDNVATAGGSVEPPLIALTGVTTDLATPEPGTWVLVTLGCGLLFAAFRLRRRSPAPCKSSSAYERVLYASASTKD